MANFLNQGQTTRDSSDPISSIIKLIRDLMVIYILTKFGDDWLIFVDDRVLTRKLWTDGRRTDRRRMDGRIPCSGELKMQVVKNKTCMYVNLILHNLIFHKSVFNGYMIT